MGELFPTAPASEEPPEGPLNSWKEIAANRNREVTRVQRWEKHEWMAVHGRPHHERAVIYLSQPESEGNLRAAQEHESGTIPAPGHRKLKMLLLVLVVLSLLGTEARAQSGPEETVSALMSSWNAKDAHAFASQFTEDATFVNVTGTIWIGKKEIEDRLANAAAFKATHAEIKTQSVRFLKPDIALVHASWTITGDPRSPQPRSYLMTIIVSKRTDRWIVVAAQNSSAFDHSVFSGTKPLPGSSLPTAVRQSAEVQELFTELDNDWNRPDALSLSKLFAEDSDLVDTSAHRFHGRANIGENIADLLAHSLAGTKSHTTILTGNSLGQDLVALEVNWELKGGAPGDTPMRIVGLRLISHREGKWRIEAAQDTAARQPAPEKP